MATPSNIAVHDVQARAVVELRVLQSFGRVELAVRAGRVVENLRQDPQHVLVVVEDLVVDPTRAVVPLNEDRVGTVNHDFPDVVVGEEWFQGPVAREVA